MNLRADRTSPAHRTLVWCLLACALCLRMDSLAHAQGDSERGASRASASSLPLPPRANGHEGAATSRPKSVASGGGLWTTVLALGAIVGTLALAGRWLKPYLGAPRGLPIEALELLGRRSIEPKVSIHLVRCGGRVLVLGVSPDGVRTLSEITDPHEVTRLTATCLNPDDSRPMARTPKATVPRGNPALVLVLVLASTFCSVAQAQERFEPPRGAGNSQVERLDARQPQPRTREAAIQPVAFEQPVAPMVVAPKGLDPNALASPAGIGSSLKILALMTVLGLVPSILMMTTCFVRFSVVLGLLRQAIGTQHAPPNQVLTALSLFLTFLVMAPVWQRCYDEGIRPYTQPAFGEQPLDEATAFQRTAAPLRQFMSQQIDRAGNADAVWMLLDFQRPAENSPAASRWHEPQSYDDVPLTVLAPAYLLSELKVAFLIGFQIFLPFLVIDLIVASILTSLGLTMLPPSLISLPFKLLLFVLIDGWFLTVGMLLESVRVI